MDENGQSYLWKVLLFGNFCPTKAFSVAVTLEYVCCAILVVREPQQTKTLMINDSSESYVNLNNEPRLAKMLGTNAEKCRAIYKQANIFMAY